MPDVWEPDDGAVQPYKRQRGGAGQSIVRYAQPIAQYAAAADPDIWGALWNAAKGPAYRLGTAAIDRLRERYGRHYTPGNTGPKRTRVLERIESPAPKRARTVSSKSSGKSVRPTTTTVRRRMPSRYRSARKRISRRARRPRGYRRKYTGSRKTVRRTKYGRVSNLNQMVRNIKPIAASLMEKKGTVVGEMYMNIDHSGTKLTNLQKNWVVRANDIVNPACIDGDYVTGSSGSTWNTNFTSGARTSVLGLNRLAPMYKEHVVTSFGYNIKFTFNTPNGTTPTGRQLYLAWRITDDPPTEVDSITSPQNLLDHIVHGRCTGWRYKLITIRSDRTFSTRLKGVIPTRKFFRYPIFTRTEALEQTCATPDATPANWTSPANPCYFQWLLFVWDATNSYAPLESHVPDYIDNAQGGLSTGTVTWSKAASYYISYMMNYSLYFKVRSTERDEDILIQSTTTDGGNEASGETEKDAITSTWSATIADT